MEKVGFCDYIAWKNEMTLPKVLSLVADIYFHFGGRTVEIISSNKKEHDVIFTKLQDDQPLWFMIAKVVSYATIILPLIALAIKAVVRYSGMYKFNVVDKNPKIREEGEPEGVKARSREILTSLYEAQRGTVSEVHCLLNPNGDSEEVPFLGGNR